MLRRLALSDIVVSEKEHTSCLYVLGVAKMLEIEEAGILCCISGFDAMPSPGEGHTPLPDLGKIIVYV